MVSARQLGHLSGWAVALGIGAAIASQGTAHADSTPADSPVSSPAAGTVDKGPKRPTAISRPKPLAKIGDTIDNAAAQANAVVHPATRNVTGSFPVIKPLDKPSVKPLDKPSIKPLAAAAPKPSPEQFEAQQVERLKNLFEPKTAATTPNPAAATAAVTTERDPNPFRAEDPGPYGIPATIVQAENALLAPLPAPLKPYVREGYEAAYRASQIVPYVNVAIPVGEIVKVLPGLAAGDAAAKDSAQIIVNQLLLTTPPVSLVYYMYDEIADLLNVEEEAQARKEEFYALAWDTLDPQFLLHNQGNPGI